MAWLLFPCCAGLLAGFCAGALRKYLISRAPQVFAARQPQRDSIRVACSRVLRGKGEGSEIAGIPCQAFMCKRSMSVIGCIGEG
jgi:hypothetical protein